MSPEKDVALCAKYPKIFRDRNAPMTQTCMCWGFECGDGWYDIIDVLCRQIQHHVEHLVTRQSYQVLRGDLKQEDAVPEEDLQVVAAQVKEKFGGLRFYIDGGDDEVRGMVAMAESMSYRICEDCGGRGTLRKGGWHRTMCDPCHETWDARRAERWKQGSK